MTNKPAREAEARESYQREIMAKVARENLIRWLVDSYGYEWEIDTMAQSRKNKKKREAQARDRYHDMIMSTLPGWVRYPYINGDGTGGFAWGKI